MANLSDNLKFSHLVFEIFLYMFQYKVYRKDNTVLADSIYKKINNFGGLIVKITQWMMTRVEFMYNGMYNNLSLSKKLTLFYEQCPPHPFDYTKELLEKNFKKPMNEIFKTFDRNSIASGSIGQVYKAIYNGKKVAVKIKHPNINNKLKIYSDIVINVYNKISKLPFVNKYLLPVSLEGLLDYLNMQVNFKYEARNFEKFRKTFKNYKNIVIPKVYYSSEDILILEYIEGKSIDNIKDVEYAKKAITTLYLFARESFILHGYLHADLHKGNWKVLLPRNKNDLLRIVIFDAGLVLEENKKKIPFSKLWYIFERKEYREVTELITRNIENLNNNNIRKIKDELYNELKPNQDKDLWTDIMIIMRYITNKKLIINFDVFNYLISLNILISNFQNVKLFQEDNWNNAFYAKYFTDRLLYFISFSEKIPYYKNIREELDRSHKALTNKFSERFKKYYEEKDSQLKKIENIIDLDIDDDEEDDED